MLSNLRYIYALTHSATTLNLNPNGTSLRKIQLQIVLIDPACISGGYAETRRKPFPGGSAATSLLLTVSAYPPLIQT